MPTAGLISQLRAVVGTDGELVDSDMKASYEIDWTRRFHGVASAVVSPGDASGVAGVLEARAASGGWCGPLERQHRADGGFGAA